MNVYKVGSFYPYGIVAAQSEDEAREIVKADTGTDPYDPHALCRAEGCGNPDWKIERLDISVPGVIDVNCG